MPTIYQLNFTNNNTYVGQTSNPIEARIRQHVLTKGSGCPKLHKAWKTETYLGYEILEECSIDMLDEREQYYIATLNPTLNILPGGKSLRGLSHPKSKYTKEQIESVIKLFITTTLNYKQISDSTNVEYATVHDILKQRQHQWAWEAVDPKLKQEVQDIRNKHYVFYDADNNIYEFTKNINQCEQELKLSHGTLRRVLQGTKSQTGWSATPHPVVELTNPLGETRVYTLFRAIEHVKSVDALSRYQLSRLQGLNNSAGWSIKLLSENLENIESNKMQN